MRIIREGEPQHRILDGPVVSVTARSAGIVIVVEGRHVHLREPDDLLPPPLFDGRHELRLLRLEARDLAHAILHALPPELRAED